MKPTENCVLLGYFALFIYLFIPYDVSGHPVGPIFKGLENGTDRVSRKFGTELPLLNA
jgi:hypothetical protein